MSSCAASTQAVEQACRVIRRGDADAVLVAGSDAPLTVEGLMGLHKLGILEDTGNGELKPCRPFDQSRQGTLPAEGAGMVLLMSDTAVDTLRCPSLATLLGEASTLDGYQITAPDPQGTYAEACLRQALQNEGIAPASLDWVHLHGTGTIANDPVELAATARALGDAAEGMAASSTKDRHGHLIAGAGIMELMVVLASMRAGLIPGTINLKHPIPSHGLNLLTDAATPAHVETVMMQNFAFGGVNCALVLRKS